MTEGLTQRINYPEDLDCRLAWRIQRVKARDEMEVDLKQLYQDQWTNSGSPSKVIFKRCGFLIQVLSKERHSPILSSLVLREFVFTESERCKLVSVVPLGSCIASVEDPNILGVGFDLDKMNDMVRYKYRFKIPTTYILNPDCTDKNIMRLSGYPQSDINIYFYGFLRRSG